MDEEELEGLLPRTDLDNASQGTVSAQDALLGTQINAPAGVGRPSDKVSIPSFGQPASGITPALPAMPTVNQVAPAVETYGDYFPSVTTVESQPLSPSQRADLFGSKALDDAINSGNLKESPLVQLLPSSPLTEQQKMDLAQPIGAQPLSESEKADLLEMQGLDNLRNNGVDSLMGAYDLPESPLVQLLPSDPMTASDQAVINDLIGMRKADDLEAQGLAGLGQTGPQNLQEAYGESGLMGAGVATQYGQASDEQIRAQREQRMLDTGSQFEGSAIMPDGSTKGYLVGGGSRTMSPEEISAFKKVRNDGTGNQYSVPMGEYQDVPGTQGSVQLPLPPSAPVPPAPAPATEQPAAPQAPVEPTNVSPTEPTGLSFVPSRKMKGGMFGIDEMDVNSSGLEISGTPDLSGLDLRGVNLEIPPELQVNTPSTDEMGLSGLFQKGSLPRGITDLARGTADLGTRTVGETGEFLTGQEFIGDKSIGEVENINSAIDAIESVAPVVRAPAESTQPSIRQGAQGSPQRFFADRVRERPLTDQEIRAGYAYADRNGINFNPQTGFSKRPAFRTGPATPPPAFSTGPYTRPLPNDPSGFGTRPLPDGLQDFINRINRDRGIGEVRNLPSRPGDTISIPLGQGGPMSPTTSYERESAAREARMDQNSVFPDAPTSGGIRDRQGGYSDGDLRKIFGRGKRLQRAKALAQNGIDPVTEKPFAETESDARTAELRQRVLEAEAIAKEKGEDPAEVRQRILNNQLLEERISELRRKGLPEDITMRRGEFGTIIVQKGGRDISYFKEDVDLEEQLRRANLMKGDTMNATGDSDTIPQNAIDLLKKNPDTRDQFDKKYGAGSSDKFLAEGSTTD